MKRVYLCVLIAASLFIVGILITVGVVAMPFVEGNQYARELTNVSTKETSRTGTVIWTREQMPRSWKVSPEVDFERECIVLVPYLLASDCDASLGTSRLESRTLKCQIRFRDRNPHSTFRTLGFQFCSMAIAVNKSSVDVMEIDVGRGPPLVIRIEPQ